MCATRIVRGGVLPDFFVCVCVFFPPFFFFLGGGKAAMALG